MKTNSRAIGIPPFASDGAPLPLPPPKPELIQKHLEKVLVSAEMCRSKQLCQFLRFTVDEVLQGHGSELKEYAIAVGVFRRGREFDPGADPIVRVQARRLRAKLERYYRTEGRDELVRIEYPVGSYSPLFTRRLVPQDAPRSAVAGPASLCRQIAVLPFLNVSTEDCQSFCDGLTEDLMHALSSCPGVRMVARSSCFEFKGLSVDVRTIGQRLGVSALISGSVRLEGGRLRALAQLIDTETGVNVWSGVYDRELDGILATQAKIAGEIAAALQAQLNKSTTKTANAAAF
jgi:TolB-like protein